LPSTRKMGSRVSWDIEPQKEISEDSKGVVRGRRKIEKVDQDFILGGLYHGEKKIPIKQRYGVVGEKSALNANV